MPELGMGPLSPHLSTLGLEVGFFTLKSDFFVGFGLPESSEPNLMAFKFLLDMPFDPGNLLPSFWQTRACVVGGRRVVPDLLSSRSRREEPRRQETGRCRPACGTAPLPGVTSLRRRPSRSPRAASGGGGGDPAR